MNRKGYSPLSNEDYEYAPPTSRNGGLSSTMESTRLMPQNPSKKAVYVFSDGTVRDSDEIVELTQMTQRQKSYRSTGAQQYESDVVIKEIPLTKDDTLQSLSIKFRCSIAEIKQRNQMYSDGDFYARKTIKIPVRSHQNILKQELDQLAKEREAAAQQQRPRKASYSPADIVSSEVSDNEESIDTSRVTIDNLLTVHSDPEDNESTVLLDRNISTSSRRDDKERDKRKFEKIISRKDKQLQEILEKVQRQPAALEEVSAVLRTPPTLTGPLPPDRRCTIFTPTISLRGIIITAVIVVILVPLIYFVYYEYYKK